MPGKPGVGRAEAEVLRYIADHHPITVREVADYLAEAKGQTRTTALNVMERLREKGFLTRSKVEGVYHYSPSQPRSQLLRSLVGDFVDGVLGGSLDPFVSYLAHQEELSEEQTDELREMLARLDQKQEENKP